MAATVSSGINATYIAGYANSIVGIINGILVPTLIAIAFIVFLYGIFKYFIKGADSDKERETGRTFALYGVIGFVILFSVWGLVWIFMSTLGLSTTNAPAFPAIPGSSSGQSQNGNSIQGTEGYFCTESSMCAPGYTCDLTNEVCVRS